MKHSKELTKIIQEAQAEADRKLSSSDQMKNLERETIRIKNELVEECDQMKYSARQDAEGIRLQATGRSYENKRRC